MIINFQNDNQNAKRCLHYSDFRDNSTFPNKKSIKSLFQKWGKKYEKKIQSMASSNTEGNAMDMNSKDYSIQPFFDDKQNPTV